MGGIISPELALITLSVIIAAFSYAGQKQTQMRESLEQLDDTVLSSTHKAVLLLHGYSIVPRRTKLNFRVYYTPYTGGQGSKAEPPFQRLSDGERDEFLEDVRSIGGGELPSVAEADVRDYEVIISVKSINPIAVRRVADEIALKFNNEYSDNF